MINTETYFVATKAAIAFLLDLGVIFYVFRAQSALKEKLAWAVGLFFFPVFGGTIWGINSEEKKRVGFLNSKRLFRRICPEVAD